VADLVRALRAAQATVAQREAALEEAVKAATLIEQQSLPELMRELGMREFVLTDGAKLSVKTDYHCSIPKAQQAQAFAWLREHKAEALIKRTVSAVFGRGEDAIADQTLRQLRQLLGEDARIEEKTAVAPQTLAAFVRERFANQQEVPRELFGVFEVTKAIIKPAKRTDDHE